MPERVYVIEYIYAEYQGRWDNYVVMVTTSLAGETQEKYGVFIQQDETKWHTANQVEGKGDLCYYQATLWEVKG